MTKRDDHLHEICEEITRATATEMMTAVSKLPITGTEKNATSLMIAAGLLELVLGFTLREMPKEEQLKHKLEFLRMLRQTWIKTHNDKGEKQ